MGEESLETLMDFKQHFTTLYRVTNITKYRSFQYRLLLRGIPTNIQLHYWGIVDTGLCFFCKKERETICHLFYQCEVVQQIWQQVTTYCHTNFPEQNINLSLNSVILNTLVNKKCHAINLICLLTKQFIYRQKCQKKELNFQNLKSNIRSIQNIEKYIAVKNYKLAIHNRKWGLDVSVENLSVCL